MPGLSDLFGPAPGQMTVREAKAKVRRALGRLGLEGVDAEAVLDRFDEEWRLRVEVGKNA